VKVCRNGSSRPLCFIEVETLADNSLKVKEKIIRGVRQESCSLQVADNIITGSIKQMRLFTINGIELHDTDSVDMLKDGDYIYFSFGKSLL
jgi:hypothetical protein